MEKTHSEFEMKDFQMKLDAAHDYANMTHGDSDDEEDDEV